MKNNYMNWKSWSPDSFGKESGLERAYFANIIRLLKPKNSSKVLEIGFGNGSFLGYMDRNGFDISGVEINNNLVDLAVNRNFNAYTSIDKIDLNIKYDLIILFDVLEHIPENKVDSFLRKISFRLKDEGLLFLRFPNGSSPLGLENQHGDITHCNIITMPKLNYWCNNLSLQVKLVRGDIRPFIFKHNYFKMPSRLLKRFLYYISEKLVRTISIQSKGILSSNLEVIVAKNEN